MSSSAADFAMWSLELDAVDPLWSESEVDPDPRDPRWPIDAG